MKKQCCRKRNLVYEIWCRRCEMISHREIEEMKLDREEEKRRKAEVKLHKYIGETSRSTFERIREHLSAFQQISGKSFMVKHYVTDHAEEEMEEEMFGVRVIKYTRTAFERQILESVLIQDENKKSFILNSKSEYNRCALPRLTSKLGEHAYEEEKAAKEERRKEDELEEKIRRLRKEINVKRRKKDEEREE